MENKNITSVKKGVIAVIPVLLGYLPVGIAYGLLAKNTGLSLKDTGLFSFIVYAGASQFMALDLMTAGVSTGGIILATFLLNLRHLIMSASISIKLPNVKRKYLPIIASGITDETFSLLSFTKEDLNAPFVITVTMLAYLTWGLTSMLGYLVGEILPKSLQASLGIGLYAMFVALLFPNFKTDNKTLKLSILTAMIYIIIFKTGIFTGGWDIILGIILSSFIGVIAIKDREVEMDE